MRKLIFISLTKKILFTRKIQVSVFCFFFSKKFCGKNFRFSSIYFFQKHYYALKWPKAQKRESFCPWKYLFYQMPKTFTNLSICITIFLILFLTRPELVCCKNIRFEYQKETFGLGVFFELYFFQCGKHI